MRLRFAVLALLASALVAAVVPAVSSAAPEHNRGLTIHVTPNPILAGEGVLIYGQLNGGTVAGQRIVLYHHVAGSHMGFTQIGLTTTDSHGFYEFTRAEGVVETNRSWFVREGSVHGIHSRTIHERVAALVSIVPDKTSSDTKQPVVFTGHVDPDHAGERVVLQQETGNGAAWHNLKAGVLRPGSNYAITYRWRIPGDHTVRVLFRGDHRNTAGTSDTATISIQQAQIPDFTINTTDPIIAYGQSATISGVLYMKGTTTPDPNVPVTLCGRATTDTQFTCDTAGMTGSDGSYSFNVAPPRNEVYLVETTLAPHRHTAPLFEGVQDLVTLNAASTNVTAGQSITLTGTVTPDKAGDAVFLQRLGADGDWHTVAIGTVSAQSTFQFVRVPGNADTKTFRARVPGDPSNVGGTSPSVNVTVTLPPVASLPQGS
jgi:hypothetical protein